MTLREQLTKAVIDTGMTDQEIARALRLSRPTITRYRTGANYPMELMIPRLLKDLAKLKEEHEKAIL